MNVPASQFVPLVISVPGPAAPCAEKEAGLNRGEKMKDDFEGANTGYPSLFNFRLP